MLLSGDSAGTRDPPEQASIWRGPQHFSVLKRDCPCWRLTGAAAAIISFVTATTGNSAFSLVESLFGSVLRLTRAVAFCLAFAAGLAALLALSGCGGSEEATGASFTPETTVQEAAFNKQAATGTSGALIDTSSVSEGYVAASATSSSRLKLQVSGGGSSANYDLPQDGTPIVAPLTFGDGSYEFRVMQNTSGNNYVELYRTTANVQLESEFAPFLRPNVFCSYDAESVCVAKARELVANAQNQGEAVEAICTYVVENVSYDEAKAQELKEASGYVPDPDATLSSQTGICFDYASLGAAMLRSQGIPTKIVTGYVSPSNIYHAWIMVYIDGTWKSAQFSVEKDAWSRVDLTFAAGGSSTNVGDGKSYTDRFTY